MNKNNKPIETQDLLSIYESSAEWIRFADAKAGVVLTFISVLAALFVSILSTFLKSNGGFLPIEWWKCIVIGSFFIWLILAVLSGIHALLCILPYRHRGKHPTISNCSHFHPAAISKNFKRTESKKFISEYKALGNEELQEEILSGLLVDSHISTYKYKHVILSIRLLAVSFCVGLFFMIAAQF